MRLQKLYRCWIILTILITWSCLEPGTLKSTDEPDTDETPSLDAAHRDLGTDTEPQVRVDATIPVDDVLSPDTLSPDADRHSNDVDVDIAVGTDADITTGPVCGNDVIEENETCDPPSSCPTSCDDGNPCTTGTLSGSAANCNARCTFEPITTCTDDDGCCAQGCNATNDNDCDPACQSSGVGCLTDKEQTLFDAINEYRVENGLSPIVLSYSLTTVARAHVKDLNNHGSTVLSATCNMHSWSTFGPWTACCYTSDHAQASCMWNKPSEITNYSSNGYEISVSTSNPTTALSLWKNSPGHNSVILNQGVWGNHTWRAIGIGADGGYAHVWFGTMTDPDTF
ncbi:MAG: CAP domain-containing protein [Bradymonadaceae bacterium]